MPKDLAMLMILDGFGISKAREGNAIYAANRPNLTNYWNIYPHTTIYASGLDVGLPEGQMGNSEVGHLNIGAGRIVYQDLVRITKDIKEGPFFENPEFLAAIENAKNRNSALHLMGLVSDGGVHSHIEHLYALLELAKSHGLQKVYVHCFLDGRDVPPASAKIYIEALQSKINELGIGDIATVMGRYYAMDRDKRWDRVKKAYDAMVLGEGYKAASGLDAVDMAYNRGETDEFVVPTVIEKDGRPVATIQPHDSIIFFNFRADRVREITSSFIKPDFDGFERARGYFPVFFVSMTQYDVTFTNISYAYTPQELRNTFGEYISGLGLKQLRIAETEKYAHVTFFFNGGVELPNEGEDRVLIPSPKVATYDLKPEMSAFQVTDEVIRRIESDKYDTIIINYANPDMVGHTGIMEAAVAAIEAVDKCVGRVVETVRSRGGKVIITADHGNAEQMVDYATGEPFTAHTSNPVPFVLVDDKRKTVKLREQGRLADVIPTLLEIMNVQQPAEMSGQSLIV
jgi:2,3-bisphosphoglycerate-independent phosphoglycerate mutase